MSRPCLREGISVIHRHPLSVGVSRRRGRYGCTGFGARELLVLSLARAIDDNTITPARSDSSSTRRAPRLPRSSRRPTAPRHRAGGTAGRARIEVLSSFSKATAGRRVEREEPIRAAGACMCWRRERREGLRVRRAEIPGWEPGYTDAAGGGLYLVCTTTWYSTVRGKTLAGNTESARARPNRPQSAPLAVAGMYQDLPRRRTLGSIAHDDTIPSGYVLSCMSGCWYYLEVFALGDPFH